ncbi:hypothetical protein D0O09_11975 [Pseudomonas putida]|nr:hypothetical protein D0O09_11975 [Pseudomonas putida]
MGGTPVAWVGFWGRFAAQSPASQLPQVLHRPQALCSTCGSWLAGDSGAQPPPSESHAGNQRDVAVGLALASAHDRTGTA